MTVSRFQVLALAVLQVHQAFGQFIRICHSPDDDGNCSDSIVMNENSGTYLGEIPADDRIFLNVVDNTSEQFGMSTNLALFNCYLVRVDEQPSHGNRFIGKGCPEKEGIVIRRHRRSILIEATLGQLLPKLADYSLPFRIHCFVMKCSSRRGRRRRRDIIQACPDSLLCPSRTAWRPRLEHLSEAVTEAVFRIKPPAPFKTASSIAQGPIQTLSPFIRLCRTWTVDEECVDSLAINPTDGSYASPLSVDQSITFYVVDNSLSHFGKASTTAPYNCYFVRGDEEPAETNRFIWQGCPERDGVILHRSSRLIFVEVEVGVLLEREVDTDTLADASFHIRCFVVHCSLRKSTPMNGHECPPLTLCQGARRWLPRAEFLDEAASAAAIRIKPPEQMSAPVIQVCRTPQNDEDCRQSMPINTFSRTYLTAIFNDENVFFAVVDKTTQQFGKNTLTLPYDCHMLQRGEQPSEENRFILRGCPARHGITMYRSKRPSRVELLLGPLLGDWDDFSRPFHILCSVVQCANRTSTPANDNECPSPYHCDHPEPWEPREEYLDKAISEAAISIRSRDELSTAFIDDTDELLK